MDKIVDPNVALKAYGNTAGLAKAPGADSASADSVSFGEFLNSSIKSSLETMKAGEAVSARAVTGQADLTDVVQAVTAAEVTLQTVMAVRDRLIGAFQDIMRMPI